MFLLDKPFSGSDFAGHAELDLRNVGPKAWPVLLPACTATDLRLYHITLQTLDGIEKLRSVTRLRLEWANRIDDLSPLFRLHRLTSLSVFDFPKLRVLEGIESLHQLAELHLSGNRGSLTPPLQLRSIEPVTRIPKLATFSLENARLEDDDITVLARCERLRDLALSNRFDRGQFAFLAKRLNPQLATPIAAYRASSLKCETCAGNKAMFTGRRMPFLCPSCDATRFEKYVSEFDRLVREA